MAEAGDKRIVEYLKEARATELALLRLLAFHSSLTASKLSREAIAQQAERTRTRVERVTRRMNELGVYPSSGPGLSAQLTTARVLGYAWRPLQFLLGRSAEERLWETAKREVAVEGRAIANYFALETLARRVGDSTTSRLAAQLRDEEEQMLEDQRRDVPELADAAVQAELAELSFDMTETGSWWAYDELTVDQLKAALARVRPPDEQREGAARQTNGSPELN
jgi:ferritin-like metal-binding protein YciE